MSSLSDRLDVVVVGGGIAGTTLAGALARSGKAVALVDLHSIYPHDFRAESFGAPEMQLFEKLGWGDVARGCTVQTDTTHVVHFGRLARQITKRGYHAPYHHLVNGLRAGFPPGFTLIAGRVKGLELGTQEQQVTLSDGQDLKCRLVVLATGLGEALSRKVGISKVVFSAPHSLALGFDMAAAREAFPFAALTYYAESFGQRNAFLSFIPFQDKMRGNLFCYREANEPWTKAFRTNPKDALTALMPNLPAYCPYLDVAGRVEVRPTDLRRAADYERDGLVLVGDAFQTVDPAISVGMRRALFDVERLVSIHLPRWLATPGMGKEKISAFYKDRLKSSFDESSIRVSLYARAINTEESLTWIMRRVRRRVGRSGLHAIYKARIAALSRVRVGTHNQ
jgi:2-polyprenyl-6-methoxyphenol hydroxylase-like FAD-dependent oxidoreductase